MATDEYPKGTWVFSKDGDEHGLSTGTVERCQLAGCNGLRIHVRWPDGKLTKPCSKGLTSHNDGWQIRQ